MSQDSLRLAGALARRERDHLKNKNTLVQACAEDNYIGFRTIGWYRKSPHRFYILREALAELEHNLEMIARDVCSFAVLHREIHKGTLEVQFYWMDNDGQNLSGYQETVTIPYDDFTAFVHNSVLPGGPSHWRVLSIDNTRKQPRIVFNSRRNLCAAIQNGIIRKKLVRFLRDGFRWPDADQIELQDDFLPYSFGFRKIKNGEIALSGGLILHQQQNDIEKAFYSIHT